LRSLIGLRGLRSLGCSKGSISSMGSKGWGLSSVDVFTNCQSKRRWIVVVEIEKMLEQNPLP
jgi:hypothetical protein